MANATTGRPDRARGLNWRLWLGGLGGVGFAALAFASLAYPVPAPADAAGAAPYLPPGAAHWLGTDGLGRDLLPVLMEGALTALVVATLALAIGLLVGLPLGWAAMVWPRLSGWLAEGAGGFALVFAPLAAAIAGTWAFGPHATVAAAAIGLANAGETARCLGRWARQLRQLPFVDAARLTGAGDWEIALTHLFPNLGTSVVALAANQIAGALLWEAMLSFAGIGAAPPRASLGLMFADAQAALPAHGWELLLVSFVLVVAVLSFRLLAAGFARTPAVPGLAEGNRLAVA
jgi:peptide/nickel transport system permease protein